ncbi:hypothetical protein ID853_17380 [Xenorhabdus sp. Vera]|uniref:hypothetical protein n=1 Tax=Xenorhabdus koppenhoeferi TaxID=351659 RepID=UPI001996FBEF|nr:hypothetical protein [Xenorhabdus sp. Vera]MBD2812601.1 hypothetical protein [Xenorhabdus sp. Vera]
MTATRRTYLHIRGSSGTNIELQSTFNVTITFVLQTGCVHIEDHRFISPPGGDPDKRWTVVVEKNINGQAGWSQTVAVPAIFIFA